MTSRTLAMAMLPAVLGSAGCFDAHAIDEGPWIIDDFEDGDLNPADRNFGPWVAFTWPQQNVHEPVLDSGDQSTFSVALDVNALNPANGSADSVGAGVQTGLAVTPEDLSRFGEIVFSAKVVPGIPGLPSTTNFAVHLACSTARTEGDGTTPGNLYVLQLFHVTTDWQSIELPMSRFYAPPFLSTHVQGGPANCMRHVDVIDFEIQPILPAGQSAVARLDIDQIRFR